MLATAKRAQRACQVRSFASFRLSFLASSHSPSRIQAVALNAFSRSARSSMLSRPAAQPQASTAPASQGLDRLDLTLSFRSTSGRSKAKKPKLSATSSDSQSQSPELASQTQLSQPPEVTLTSHLLSPSSLHFTLVPQLATALERLAKKLVVAFPLCFNPRWQDVSFHTLQPA